MGRRLIPEQSFDVRCSLHSIHTKITYGLSLPQLTVLTCMDSRLIPEQLLGLEIGDAEVIRNAGGRVTTDVLR